MGKSLTVMLAELGLKLEGAANTAEALDFAMSGTYGVKLNCESAMRLLADTLKSISGEYSKLYDAVLKEVKEDA